MKVISQIKYTDVDLNFMVEKDSVGYSFEFGGKSYGHKTTLKTKKRDELVGAVATLTVNAVQSYESLKNGENTNN